MWRHQNGCKRLLQTRLCTRKRVRVCVRSTAARRSPGCRAARGRCARGRCCGRCARVAFTRVCAYVSGRAFACAPFARAWVRGCVCACVYACVIACVRACVRASERACVRAWACVRVALQRRRLRDRSSPRRPPRPAGWPCRCARARVRLHAHSCVRRVCAHLRARGASVPVRAWLVLRPGMLCARRCVRTLKPALLAGHSGSGGGAPAWRRGTRTDTRTHQCARMRTNARAHGNEQARMYACTPTHSHPRTHARTHARSHTDTRTHALTQTQTLAHAHQVTRLDAELAMVRGAAASAAAEAAADRRAMESAAHR